MYNDIDSGIFISTVSFASSKDKLVDSIVFTTREDHITVNLDMSWPWSINSMF